MPGDDVSSAAAATAATASSSPTAAPAVIEARRRAAVVIFPLFRIGCSVLLVMMLLLVVVVLMMVMLLIIQILSAALCTAAAENVGVCCRVGCVNGGGSVLGFWTSRRRLGQPTIVFVYTAPVPACRQKKKSLSTKIIYSAPRPILRRKIHGQELCVKLQEKRKSQDIYVYIYHTTTQIELLRKKNSIFQTLRKTQEFPLGNCHAKVVDYLTV